MDTEVSTQVIVVGAGNAALSAAVAARERGAEVVVLEKAPRQHRGGNSALTVHMRFPYEGMDDLTPLLSGTPSADLDRMADQIGRYTPADYYDDIMNVTEGKSDPQLAEVLVSERLHRLSGGWVPTGILGFQPTLTQFLRTWCHSTVAVMVSKNNGSKRLSS